MALKLNIRWQLALVSVALSLLPIAVVGILAYQIAPGLPRLPTYGVRLRF